jgi:hypothetical protein
MSRSDIHPKRLLEAFFHFLMGNNDTTAADGLQAILLCFQPDIPGIVGLTEECCKTGEQITPIKCGHGGTRPLPL